MNPGVSPWSAQQRRWLQALGHAVLRVGGGEPDASVAEAGDGLAEDRVRETARPRPPAATLERSPAEPAAAVPRPTPPRLDDGGQPPASTARPGMRRPARLPDRLQLALLRASGLDPADPAAQAAMAQWPVDRLRGDAAAKRAFWPQLRALRRRSS